MTSCKGSDEPEPGQGSAPVVVTLQLDSAMIDYKTVNEIDCRAGGDCDLRCQVRVYTEKSSGSLGAEPVATATVMLTGASQQNECRMVLPSGRYRVLAWADYVDASRSDKYFNTADFGDIYFSGDKNYSGNTTYRNAYSGSVPCEFSVPQGDTSTVVRKTLPLSSVMGMVKFVATDYNKYLENGQNLRVVVAYTGFLPNHYSVIRGVPFDATTGVNFLSAMSELNTEGAGRATLGYDYVMVNGNESSVSMALGLYNDEGKLVGTSTTMNVPLRRGGITVIEGEFLTKTSGGGGVGIDPNFEGDIIIYY